MSKVLSLRLKEDQVERLERAARRWGRSPSSAAVLLLEEALRQREFPYVEFRDSVVGRQAYLNGHRLTVWQIEWIARYFDHDAGKTADYLRIRPVQVEGALSYADAYPEEIEYAIADNDRTYEELKRMIPNLQLFEFHDVDSDSA